MQTSEEPTQHFADAESGRDGDPAREHGRFEVDGIQAAVRHDEDSVVFVLKEHVRDCDCLVTKRVADISQCFCFVVLTHGM